MKTYIRRNRKDQENPFTHTNLTTLTMSIQEHNGKHIDVSFVVNFPSLARKTEEDF